MQNFRLNLIIFLLFAIIALMMTYRDQTVEAAYDSADDLSRLCALALGSE